MDKFVPGEVTFKLDAYGNITAVANGQAIETSRTGPNLTPFDAVCVLADFISEQPKDTGNE